MKKRLATTFGIKGEELLEEEKRFFSKNLPFGFILFSRNLKEIKKVEKLTADLKEIAGFDIPILIDQEGGRVQRFDPSIFFDMPSAKTFGDVAKQDIKKAEKLVYDNFSKCSKKLKNLGINYNCVPVLDIRDEKTTKAIGDRAFGEDKEIISNLGKQVCKASLEQGVFPVMKHIPGHGRALVDSHLDLPVVKASRKDLEKNDFYPFCELNTCPFAMTAHIVYQDIDDEYCATFSKKIIKEIIRDYIGFKGVLFSDDFSMKALKGTLEEKATRILSAGCDILLHCNGEMSEMKEIARITPYMGDELLEKLQRIESNNNA